MAQIWTGKAGLSHEERTATEPRDNDLHLVILDSISVVNDRIRTYRFATKDRGGIKFLAGQWLDVHVPGIDKAGGFTITSSPRHARPAASEDASKPFFELAVQQSPDNPPAAWLWQPEEHILGRELAVRVGGSFVWPPPGVAQERIKRVVFIAGGVGINPFMSMLSHIREEEYSLEVHMLYSTKVPDKSSERDSILFLPQILEAFGGHRISPDRKGKDSLQLFLTCTWSGEQITANSYFQNSLDHQPGTSLSITTRIHRIEKENLLAIIGNEDERRHSVYYVCGPPEMTDSIVEYLRQQEGVTPESVLCEKWW
ncbi:hypothetical protein P154DRAFT_580536 [Amniculicola lignicola CBS 123094]|uniref:FAD-binding FR-type domain-containing protein n=1 Tax=Amniculicola lignicola CBS 123094 TaxID=1392246 RepID=A0A6A5W1Q6_9PLEO|nr:hypothetical protein P154DRAFT_580536 [Amniculicola lignicola CBS 123094]